jgi:hypothetical protein
MEPDIVFVPSAFKHEVSEENIRWALTHHLADGVVDEDDEQKRVTVGWDRNGNLLEVFYNELPGNVVKVFHAMKCRDQFRKEAGI